MKINEIFHTIQGEGPRTGISSIFIRLAGCNLRCTFCDTKYTWLFSEKTLVSLQNKLTGDALKELGNVTYQKQTEVKELKVSQIINQIRNYPAKNVVFTGGEPLLQTRELVDLINQDFFLDKTIEIETNGTVDPLDIEDERIHYNVSPKLANSFNPKNRRYVKEILQKFLSKKSIFKFVVAEESDLNEILMIIDDVQIPKERVYLMPKAVNQDQLNMAAPKIFNLSLSHGFSYSHRVHIQLFGEKRGI